jgi:hypothetical protein
MTLTAKTAKNKTLLLLLHQSATRPSSDERLVWTEAITLEAQAFGTASVEITIILRNHGLCMDRAQDQNPDPTVRRYWVRPL